MKLFEDKIRTDVSPAKHIDNSFDFCDRNAQLKVEKVRNILNYWFSHYPIEEQYELKCRFQKDFNSALQELFLYELFFCQGFEIVIHPTLPHTSKNPDFLLSKDGIEFYLEAKVSTGKSNTEKSYEQRLNNLYDSLNKINSPNFFLDIKEILLKTQKQPSAKVLIKFIETELAKYDPDVVEIQIENENKKIDDLTNIQYENEDIFISLYLIPKATSIRDKDGVRPISVFPSTSYWGGSEDTIKASLEKKATRYGDLGKPYIISVNSLSEIMTNEYDANNAIWGSLQISYSTDSIDKNFKYTRAKDGFFLDHRGVRHTGVSGILITRFYLGNLHNIEYWFFKHPSAKYDLDFGITEMSYSYVSDNQIMKTENHQVSDILSIPEEWIDI